MNYQSSAGSAVRRQMLLSVVACIIFSGTSAQSSQLPLPLPNSPTMRFQEQKAMFPETAAHHTETVGKILKAIATNDEAAFLFRGSPNFQKGAPQQLGALVSEWSTRLKDGFRFSPIGELRKSYATSLWRVQSESKGDEALLILATDKRGNIVTLHFM